MSNSCYVHPKTLNSYVDAGYVYLTGSPKNHSPVYLNEGFYRDHNNWSDHQGLRI